MSKTDTLISDSAEELGCLNDARRIAMTYRDADEPPSALERY
jgi:hypothetical protein